MQSEFVAWERIVWNAYLAARRSDNCAGALRDCPPVGIPPPCQLYYRLPKYSTTLGGSSHAQASQNYSETFGSGNHVLE